MRHHKAEIPQKQVPDPDISKNIPQNLCLRQLIRIFVSIIKFNNYWINSNKHNIKKTWKTTNCSKWSEIRPKDGFLKVMTLKHALKYKHCSIAKIPQN